MTDEKGYNLKSRNTFGISATCDRFVEFSSTDELISLLPLIRTADPLLIVGAGSNLLLTGDFHGTVVHSAIMGREAQEDGNDMLLRCGSGETFDDIIAYSLEKGWHGAENLSLIPGEVGASAVQNIGAYGVEAKDIIECVEAVEIETGKTLTISNAECQYAYRQSRFKQEWKGRFIITHVTYRLSRSFVPQLGYGNIRSVLLRQGIDNPTPQQLRQIIIDIRREKLPDPAVEGNAGSFFMNPIIDNNTFARLIERYPDMPHYPVDGAGTKIPAAWLIDQCGWKGRTVGHAGVHSRQPLVLVNRGGATGEEIVNLCNLIRHDVEQKFGITISPEVNIV
ncbi:MAG: UDP-N-acetylmuramate dehydrogenase [Prevotella sp.]|nr:UDP-N-acetylmuramate dehydrogenase [Prevotella sp.]